MMRLNILGTGAIGSAIAAAAEHHAMSYRIFTRTPGPRITVSALNAEKIALAAPLSEPLPLDRNDLLLLPLKAYQLEPALIQWQPFVQPETPIVLMHNGMGGAETAHQHLPDNPIFLATTRMAALKLAANQVQVTGRGVTDVGFITPHRGMKTAVQKAVFATLRQCLGDVRWHQDVYPALWHKLSINAVINPLTALYDIRNGELTTARFAEQIHLICEEIAAVMRAHGLPAEAESVKSRVLDVAASTADNYSSMHQDVTHHRQTEIEAINGYIVNQAKKKGIAVPENALLVKQITALTPR